MGAFKNPRRFKPSSPLDKAKGYEVVWDQVSEVFNATRCVVDIRFVYFIGEADDGPLKIGVSRDPIKRLRGMQTGNPRRLRVEHVLVGYVATEGLLHELWEPFAIKSARAQGKVGAAPGTEWFEPGVRETLLPIVATAARRQAAHLRTTQDATYASLARIVRDAHAESGFVATIREETRLLAIGAGYQIDRPSRL